MSVLALLLACTGQPVDSDTPVDSAPPDDDTGTAGWTASDPAPELAVEDVDATVIAVLEERLVHPLTVSDWFVDLASSLMGTGSDDCVREWEEKEEGDTTSNFTEWFGTCTADGLTLHGGWIATYEVISVGFTQTHRSNVLASFTGERDDGTSLEAGGAFHSESTRDGDGNLLFSYYVGGVFQDSLVSGGLGEGISVGIDWFGTVATTGALTGSFTGPIGGGDDALEMTSIALDPACGAGAFGTLRLRDPSGGWWTVDYADDCSGCGPVSWLGEEVGESCAGTEIALVLDQAFALALVEE